MHCALKYVNLLVCFMISYLNCRVIDSKELSSCCLRIGVIGSRWCNGSTDDVKALISCFVCCVLFSKTFHLIFHHLHHVGVIYSHKCSAYAGKIVTGSYLIFLIIAF